MSVVFPNVTIAGTVDGQGSTYRRACRAKTAAAITIATTNAGATIDGITLAAGDRLLVTEQGTAENGIYAVQSAGGLIRVEDFAAGASATSIAVYVSSGTVAANTSWVCITDPGIIGTNTLLFQQVSGTGVDGNVTTTGTQTLTNKTLTTPIISSISNGGTITLPTSTDTLVGRQTTDNLSNKTLDGATVQFADIATPGASVAKIIVSSGTGKTCNIVIANPVNQTIFLPSLNLDGDSDNIALLTLAQTFTNKTMNVGCIWNGNAVGVAFGGTGVNTFASGNVLVGAGTSPVTATKAAPSGDFVGTNDTQTLTNKLLSTACTWSGNTIAVAAGGTGATTFTSGNVLVGAGTAAVTATKVAPAGAFVGTTDAQTLTNKTLTTPTINGAVMSSITNGAATLTLPNTTDTLVGRATFDTLTNKTIASFSNGGTVTVPTGTNTLATLAAAETFTNKTMTANTNNVIARALWYGSGAGSISPYAAGTPAAGQVLTATSSTAAIWQTIATPGTIFGTEFEFIEAATFSTTNNVAQLITGSTITFNTLGAATYLVQWSWQWRYSQATTNFIFEPRVNGTSIGNIVSEPSDTALSQRRVGAAAHFIQAPGVATITIESYTAAGAAGQTASVYNLKCWVFRVA